MKKEINHNKSCIVEILEIKQEVLQKIEGLLV